MNSRRIGLFFIVALVGASGCGYQSGGLYRRGIRTVAVPIWTRGEDIYRRGLEMRLTEAIIKRIEMTPYKVTKRSRADTLLTGTIETISNQTLSKDPDTDQAREIQTTFTISFQWEDLRNGNILAYQEDYSFAGVYLPDTNYDEDFFRGSEDLIDKLAERIVEHMESPWGSP